MATTAFVNGDVYTPLRIMRRGVVVTEGDKIVHAGASGTVPANAMVTDCTGRIVAPGFVDVHLHGGMGEDFIDADQGGMRKILVHHARHGTTSLLATTSSAPMDAIFAAFDRISAMMAAKNDGAEILGIHMEGPYFAKPEPGCHIVELLHDPTPEEIERVLGYAGVCRWITLAPEIGGALELTRRATERGMCISGGHSSATYEEVRRAADAGLRHITHLWSAMSMVKRVRAKRYAGMVEAALLCDDLTTEVIADGRHLPTSLLRLAYKCKGADKLCVISDAIRASGMPEGVYEVCGLKATIEDGVALTEDRMRFAGSVITMEKAVQHMILDVGLPPIEVLRMASHTPARVIGVDARKGMLKEGMDADIVVLDAATFSVQQVMARGRLVSVGG
jgi:N-acetylglucosamine-6-phosphate deacetylase